MYVELILTTHDDYVYRFKPYLCHEYAHMYKSFEPTILVISSVMVTPRRRLLETVAF